MVITDVSRFSLEVEVDENIIQFIQVFFRKGPAEFRTYLLGLAYFHNQVWMELGNGCGDVVISNVEGLLEATSWGYV